jgi:transposase
MPSPKLVPLELTAEERQTLETWTRRRKTSQALALRSRIVVTCAEGGANVQVADRLGGSRSTVAKWRARFVEHRLEGLLDEPRLGWPADHHR